MTFEKQPSSFNPFGFFSHQPLVRLLPREILDRWEKRTRETLQNGSAVDRNNLWGLIRQSMHLTSPYAAIARRGVRLRKEQSRRNSVYARRHRIR